MIIKNRKFQIRLKFNLIYYINHQVIQVFVQSNLGILIQKNLLLLLHSNCLLELLKINMGQ